jgi:anti-sigma factor RsiW
MRNQVNWRTMRDEQRDELLSAYLDNALAADVRVRLEEQFAVDPRLRAELEALRQTVRLVRQMRPMPVSRNFILPQTMAGVRPARPMRSRLAWAAPWLTAATAAVSLLFILVLAGGTLFAGIGPTAMAPVALGERDVSGPVLEAQSIETVEVEKESEVLSTEAPMAAEAPAPETTMRADEGAMAGANTRVPTTGEDAVAEEPEMPMEPSPEQEKAVEEEMAASAVAPSPEVDAAPPAPAEEAPQDALSGEREAVPEGQPPAGAGAPPGEEGLPTGADSRATWGPFGPPVSLWLGLSVFLGLATIALTVTTVTAWRARRRQS